MVRRTGPTPPLAGTIAAPLDLCLRQALRDAGLVSVRQMANSLAENTGSWRSVPTIARSGSPSFDPRDFSLEQVLAFILDGVDGQQELRALAATGGLGEGDALPTKPIDVRTFPNGSAGSWTANHNDLAILGGGG